MDLVDKLYEELKYVFEPELVVNIVDLGLVYDIDIDEENNVTVTMTVFNQSNEEEVTNLIKGVKYAMQSVDGVNQVQVKLVFNPPWTPEMMNKQMREQLIGCP